MALSNDFFIDGSPGNISPKNLGQASGTTAGGIYMAKLGDYMFSLGTSAFEKLERVTEYRWAGQKRVGRLSAQQYTGIDHDDIELEGAIYPYFRGGLSQMALMRSAAGNGEPLPLIYAFETLGEYVGLWCIKRIKEGRTVFFPDGTPRKIEFSISLTAYGEDEDQSAIITDLIESSMFGITPPAIAGDDGIDVMTASQAASELPDITSASTDIEIEAAAGAVAGSANAANASSLTVMDRVRAALSQIASDGLSLIPSEAVTAAADIVNSASMIANTAGQIQATVNAFKHNKAQVLLSAVNMSTSMGEFGRVIGPSVTAVKSAYAQLSPLATGGSSDINRIMSAATMGSISRAADLLSFAVTQAQDQAIIIQGKFVDA